MLKIPVCPICGNRGWEGFKITNSDDLPPEAECLNCLDKYYVSEILQIERRPISKLWMIMLASGIIALLLWIPITRMIVLAILPLGYKVDDILVFALLIFGLVAFIRGWLKIPNLINIITREETKNE